MRKRWRSAVTANRLPWQPVPKLNRALVIGTTLWQDSGHALDTCFRPLNNAGFRSESRSGSPRVAIPAGGSAATAPRDRAADLIEYPDSVGPVTPADSGANSHPLELGAGECETSGR